ncbi:MAG TPA: YceI family protein [Flavobacterium sp.]|uniref:YceI family protein n=1 Tax=Flavobacterium sp. TaxID=239 RepID=UPI002C9D251B|nr:YceI family protein [Flavobacterium sp.]HSD13788.1 YceI family protein [Flavobacterium sp.]
MKTKLFLAALLSITFLGFTQSKKMTKTGEVKFEASVPSFEEVKAENKTTTVVLNTDNGDIAALALMKGFRFKIALMEEHFNENYIESDKFPKATFKGKVVDFDMSKLSETEKEFTIKGTLELHGKSKKISVPAKIKKSGDAISLTTAFSVNSDDFDIEIPSVVSKKVSKTVNIDVDCVLK